MKKNITLILLGFAIVVILFVIMGFRPEIYMPLERFLYDKREFFEIDLTQEREEIVIVDTRSVREYEVSHIEGAVSIPLLEIDDRYEELPKDKEIVLYCT